jgi:hypothetical protein
MPWNDWGDTGTLLGAVVAAGFGFRHVLSKLNLTTTSDSANQTLIKNLQEERDAHKESSEKMRELLIKAENQIGLLKEEVAAMKMYLRLKYGVTEAEFKAEMREHIGDDK